MRVTTLCYLVTNTQVLLGRKQIGVGAGKLNGPGGGVEDGESIEDACVREPDEEIKVKVDKSSLEKSGVVTFYFDKKPRFEVHIFLARLWEGVPTDTGEMKELRWYDLAKVPLDDMMPADKEWLPLILAGKKIQGEAYYTGDTSTPVLEEFRYKETS